MSISELLDLKTRARALQEFVLRTDQMAAIMGWKDLATFSKDHEDISVLVSADRHEKKKRYVVTWERGSRLEGALGAGKEEQDSARFLQPPPSSGVINPKQLGFAVFEEDGSCVELEGASTAELKGFVMDLDGDAEIDVMEAAESGSTQYVMVRHLTWPQPLFAVAYEWGEMKARGKAWGYAIRKSDGDGYDILFGPKEKDTIVPEVAFRWDGKTWTCDDVGDHLRVLGLKNVWNEILKLGADKAGSSAAPK